MTRTYHDIDGKIRTLERVGSGRVVKWHKEHPKSTSSIWYDPKSRRNYQIPDNAWDILQIVYVDQGEVS